MAEKLDGPQSAYAVAWEMTRAIAMQEGYIVGNPASTKGPDRVYVLALYRECLKAVASHIVRDG